MRPGKRVFDIVAAALGLLLLWPLFVVIALLIKLEDGGPVLFRQERIGHRGRPFRMRKFRTMRPSDGTGGLLTVGNDPRITRVGYWLRKFKVDELPQLLDVLAGRMTIVGPRPEVARYVDLYTPAQRRVLDLVPGITDPASIRYWDESELLALSPDPERTYVTQIMPEKIRIQLGYGDRATVWTDFLVVLNTLRRLWPTARPILFDRLLRHRRRFIVAAHVLLTVLAYRLAFELRFDFDVPTVELQLFWLTLPLLVILRLVTFAQFGLYRGYWKHFGASDLLNLARALTVGSAAFTGVLALFGAIPGLPRSVLVIDWGVALVLGGGIRFLARCIRELHVPLGSIPGRRALVIGTGDRAAALARETRTANRPTIDIAGFVALDPVDAGRTIHGITVHGTIDDLPRIAAAQHAEVLVIALEPEQTHRTRAVVDRCIATGLDFKILPFLADILDGRARLDQLRSVSLDDLLHRDPVHLDLRQIESDVRGKVVLVSGGAGSIGSELARQLARYGPAKLVLLDRAESPLFFITMEVSEAHPELDVVPVICDITDEAHLQRVFADHRPAYVIHAAAYKHVPMLESNVAEAIRNNVVGTLLVAQAAADTGTEKFVLISTDKAVNPASVMGATKRIAERIVLELPAFQAAATDFRAVRFGNVLGSSGSVIPIFERQLARGGPLTVTHPEVERYFMTIPEAVELVLQAAALPEASGRIAMLDMGRPVRIVDLAERIIRLAGLEPHRDVQIVFTGLRPGEKLHEELTSALEASVPTVAEKIRIVQLRPQDSDSFEARLHTLLSALAFADSSVLLDMVCDLVPECVAPLRERASGPVRRPRASEIVGAVASEDAVAVES